MKERSHPRLLRPGRRLLLAGLFAGSVHAAAGTSLLAGGGWGRSADPAPVPPVPQEVAVEVDLVDESPGKAAPPATSPARPERILRRRPGPAVRALPTAAPLVADLTDSVYILPRPGAVTGGGTPASGAPTGQLTAAGLRPGGTAGRARAVGLGATDWRCPWPAEADASDRLSELVVIRVLVDAEGRARRVEVVHDPGLGFGEAARTCAIGTRFLPALDHDGRPHQAESPPIRVRFTR